jgi:hypothetical protein
MIQIGIRSNIRGKIGTILKRIKFNYWLLNYSNFLCSGRFIEKLKNPMLSHFGEIITTTIFE